MRELGISRFYIQEYKRIAGLAKSPFNRAKKKRNIVEGEFFNVDNYKDGWVA